MNARVFVAQPIYRDVPGPAAMSFAQLLVAGTMQGLVRNVGQVYSGLLGQARNALVTQALAGNYSHILFIDSDMVVQPTTLADLLTCDVPVVSALYFRRAVPHLPAAISFHDNLPIKSYGSGLERVDAVGMGCALINTDVFRLQQRHFKDSNWFSFETGHGEDVHFCKRCAEIDVPVHQLSAVKCGHVANIIITEEDYLRERGKP